MKKTTKQRRTLNHLLSFILSLSMVLSCMEGLSLKAWAEDDPVVSEDPGVEDPAIEEEPDEAVTEWTATDSLPTEGGDYKLMKDVTITKAYMVKGSLNRVDLDLNGHTITMNDKASYGVDTGAVLNISNGTINNAYLWNQQSRLFLSMLTLNGAKRNAVYATGAVALEISNSTISGCKQSALSFTNSGSTKNKVKIDNCTIKDNESSTGGAGILLDNTVALIKNSTITNNTAGNYGGGLYIGTDSRVEIKDTAITNNKSNSTDTNAGAGVYVSKNAKAGDVTIGGATEINGNKTKDGKDSNLYTEIKIRLNQQLSNTQPIGLANADTVSDKLDYTKTVVDQYYSYGLSPDSFKSDVSGYILIYNGSDKKALSLTKPFNLSVTNGIVGTSGTDTTKAVGAGDYVTIKANAAEEGQVFKHWVVNGKELLDTDKVKPSVKFQMPANDVYATAEYENKLGELNAISVINGTADKDKAIAGETVEVTADITDSHAIFDHWECMEGGVTFADPKAETTTFMMPAKKVKVVATPIPLWDVHMVNGTADKGIVKKGETITITADDAPEGKVFDKWTCETPASWYKTVSFADETSATTTFEMPDGDVKVVATYKDDDRADHNVVVKNGTADVTTAKQGDIVTITADDPEEGKVFENWTTESDGVTFADPCISKTTFTMPANDVSINAVYKTASDKEYKITVVNGKASAETAKAGTRITITADPSADPEKVFDSWICTSAAVVLKNANAATTTFIMPEEDVSFAASYRDRGITPILVHSALDPVPADLAEATDLYLVQGQKFTLGSDWTIVDKKKAGKFISISKKGLVKAKKVTPVAVTLSQNSTGRTISVNICKPVIENKKLQLDAGTEAKAIGLKDYGTLPVYWISSNPDVAVVSPSGFVTPIAKGKATVTAYINGSAYKCTVTVKEPTVATSRTLHMNVNSSKTISIKGVTNKTVWTTTSENVAKVDKKKISSKEAGTAKLSASVNGVDIYINVISEDITMKGTGLEPAKGKNKYTLTLNAGQESDLAFASVGQPIVFKSNKPETAFIDENGHVVARTKGKAKFTAKVNGKSITINVIVNNP